MTRLDLAGLAADLAALSPQERAETRSQFVAASRGPREIPESRAFALMMLTAIDAVDAGMDPVATIESLAAGITRGLTPRPRARRSTRRARR
jgi:hypothetical protein